MHLGQTGSYGHLKRQVSATASDKRKSRQLSLLTALPTRSSGQPSKPPSRPPYEPRPTPWGVGSSAYRSSSGSLTPGREPGGRGSQTAEALPDKDARAPPSRSLDMNTWPRRPPPGPPGRSRPPRSSYASRNIGRETSETRPNWVNEPACDTGSGKARESASQPLKESEHSTPQRWEGNPGKDSRELPVRLTAQTPPRRPDSPLLLSSWSLPRPKNSGSQARG